MKIDRLTAAFELKQLGEEGAFSGFASTFGLPADSQGDIMAPGAFSASLAEHAEKGTAPPMLWQHDPSMPIGRWTDIRQTDRGLAVDGKLTLEVQQAREARALLKDAALDGLSIGFRERESRPATEDEEAEGVRRVLTDVELIEISLVTMPANERARVAAIKAVARAAQIETPRAFEEFLREAGFPRAFAKSVTNRGFATAQRRRDVGTSGVDALTAELWRAADTLRTITRELARFSGLATAITVDAGSSVTAGAVLVAGTNAATFSTARLRASDTAFTTGDKLDVSSFSPGFDATYGMLLHVFAADVTARFWQLDLTATGPTRLDIGVVALLPVLRPGDGLRWPLEHRLDDLSEVAESLGGQATSYARARLREASFSFAALTETDAYFDLLTILDRAIGSGGDVLLVPDAAGAQWAAQTIWGRLNDLGGVRHQTLNLYEHAYRIREVG